ncbi:MAG: ATP-dependent DNA helicase RecG [Lachnospiraceae bacterium]|nr:ATP-dependent DNA helicase RecG [Lachnospiraceae bacterium]
MELQDSVTVLKGIGEKNAKLFSKLNIHTIQDLITYYPRDYERLEDEIPISQVREHEIVAVGARLTAPFQSKRIRQLNITTGIIQDATGKLQLTFFNMPYISKTVRMGAYYIFRGEAKRNKANMMVIEQPKVYELQEYRAKKNTLQPVYVLTKGLTNALIHKMEMQIFEQLSIEEFLPDSILCKYEFASLEEAYRKIHLPVTREEILSARKRLVYNEFFLFMMAIRSNKEKNSGIPNEHKMIETAITIRLLEQLPYELTKAQWNVWNEIKEDLEGPYCMNRLVQGDVGSGKTIIAFLSLLMTISNGYQGALMAPTEVLARQHFENIQDMMKEYHLPICPVLLTGSITAREKRDAYGLIESGEANLIIGTHALIQEKVHYQKLGLVVTDEQHRFGVRQREALAGKGDGVHVLVMSATPIPRTLAIILYGDLHISVIDELPANRLPIKNCVVNTEYRKTAYAFMQKEIANGSQIYVICPMVEEGELEDVENVMDYAEKMRTFFPETIQIRTLHGKMKPQEKNRIMEAFEKHDIDILVSTTVIEVGINVPNATVMMVENAERFGLAQLHQLRGRVGRGKKQSYCIFVSGKNKKETMERLEILNKSNDGFKIAEEDMKLRGPGDIFGIRQSGDLEFKVADIYNDASILKMASEDVDLVLSKDPFLELSENQKLKAFQSENKMLQVDFRSI